SSDVCSSDLPQEQHMTEQTAPHSPDEHEPTGASPAPAVEPVVEKELPEDIASLSYEAARDQLVEVVRRLESGQGGLEESISLWERGEMLARRCQQWLDRARERLEDAVAARRPGVSPEQCNDVRRRSAQGFDRCRGEHFQLLELSLAASDEAPPLAVTGDRVKALAVTAAAEHLAVDPIDLLFLLDHGSRNGGRQHRRAELRALDQDN